MVFIRQVEGPEKFCDIMNKQKCFCLSCIGLFDANNAFACRLEFDSDIVAGYSENYKFGFSVGCVKD
jgi:hypothetical protein